MKRFVFIALSAVSILSMSVSHAATVRTVALTGQQAPGTPSGGTYSNLQSVSRSFLLNDAGQTAFVAIIAGSGVDATNNRGIWSEGTGSLALVARNGSQAPDTPSGVDYTTVGGARPILNDTGQTAFFAIVTGSGVDGTNNTGIWSEGSGNLGLVARTGQQAPGAPSGVNYSRLVSSLVLNNAGQVAFYAELTDGRNGIWSEGSGSLALVARSGDHAPGTPSGVSFSTPSQNRFSNPPALNDAGQTAFFASLTGSGVNSTNHHGIWSERSGSLTLVARSGQPAPGTPSGVNYEFLSSESPALNNAGQIAFVGSLTGGGSGIWSEGSGNLALVARGGDLAPGTPDHFSVNAFADRPVLNDAGQTAFYAELTGGSTGIWSEGSGSLALVARTGDHAPGTPSGFSFFGSPQLNSAGQTAFSATLGDGTYGIWATDRTGDLQLIARTGDPLEVAPGDFRTIAANTITSPGLRFVGSGRPTGTGNSDGLPSGFNNSGQLAFFARFIDGSQGIFVSNRVAIPEPSAFALAAVCLLGFAFYPCRRIS